MIVGEDQEIVLNCFRLARFYHCDPRVFLDMPMFSELGAHLHYTCLLAARMREERETDED